MRTPYKISLFLPVGLKGPGFLCLYSSEGSVSVRLPPRQVSVLLLLCEMQDRHKSWPEASVGWTSANQIAEALGRSPKAYVPEPATVRKYVDRIERGAREKLAAAAERPFRLIERRPLLGYRLTVPIQIVVGSEPP